MKELLCLAALWLVPLAALADDASPTRDAYVAQDDPLGEPVTKVVYLDQGWSPSDSLRFYFTSQGSQIVPYDWFLALEQADEATPFRDPKNILKFRYLPQLPDASNPDGLPVGFVGNNGTDRKWLGLTCAACHTTEVRLEKTAYRIDGAPTMGDIQALLSSLIAAMQATRQDSAKFARFAAKVLTTHNTPAAQEFLKAELDRSIAARVGYNLRNFPGYNPAQAPPAPANYARLDALGAITNEVYHRAAKGQPPAPTAGAKAADAPVSYPFLWDTPEPKFVQWVGVQNGGPLGIFSLARNVGEVLGVFGDFVFPDTPSSFGYASSVRVTALMALEDQVKRLKSPKWPAAFPPIDQAAADKGKVLYQRLGCVKCHTLIEQENLAIMSSVATDPRTADNFFNRTGPSGKLEDAFQNVVNILDRSTIPPTADATTMIKNAVIGTILGVYKEAPPDDLNRINFRPSHPMMFAALEAPVGPKYKGRPMDGIWATAPYLHNGSVANLDDLLKPAAQRATSFTVGNRTFDPVHVGFVTNAPGFPKFSVNAPDGTPIPGNSNAGHEFGTSLGDQERRQLVEYLKSL